jgi:Protein of unknown function (DUF551)
MKNTSGNKAITQLVESHNALLDWMRARTGPADGVHEMLVNAYNVRLLIASGGVLSGWIECAKELPDPEQTVLVCTPAYDEPVWFGYHDGECWRYQNGIAFVHAVTHWMEFPEPAEVA